MMSNQPTLISSGLHSFSNFSVRINKNNQKYEENIIGGSSGINTCRLRKDRK